MTAETGIDYAKLTQDALRGVVRDVLSKVAETASLPGNHHFFVSFLTHGDGVSVSKRLRDQYPEEMTIVIQHQFWDLHVHEDRFEVKLKFNGIPEKLVVPFAAIRVFVDPSAQFAIPFDVAGVRNDDNRPKPVLASTLANVPAKPSEATPRRAGTLTAVPDRLPPTRSGAANGASDNVGPVNSDDKSTDSGSATDAEERAGRPPLRAVDTATKAPASADVVDINSFRKK